jgi:DNA-binding response OmpR family regulator
MQAHRSSQLESGIVELETSTERPLILVVEDDDEMRSLVELALRDEGYLVCGESTANAAFERVQHGEQGLAPRVDLVLSDVCLDSASGIELVAALQGMPTRASFLLMTSFASNEQRDVARVLGVEILDKPFELDALRGFVRSILAECASLAPATRTPRLGRHP